MYSLFLGEETYRMWYRATPQSLVGLVIVRDKLSVSMVLKNDRVLAARLSSACKQQCTGGNVPTQVCIGSISMVFFEDVSSEWSAQPPLLFHIPQ
jgi:hypothetical protein